MNIRFAPLLILFILLSARIVRGQNEGRSLKTPESTRHLEEMEFLFDDASIDRKEGVERVVPSPHKLATPVLAPSSAWENQGFGQVSVLFDDVERKFKMWYRADCDSLQKSAGDSSSPVIERDPSGRRHFLCYAQSLDGVQWTRPALKRFTFDGSDENNIVMEVGAGDTVFSNIVSDAADPDPNQRYKALGFDVSKHTNISGRTGRVAGIHTAFSADGIVWTKPMMVMDTFDVTDADCVLPERDPTTGRWVGFFRPRTQPKRRFVGYSTSDDFVHWTFPQMLLTPDLEDAESTEFYGLSATTIAGARVGALWVFQNDPSFSPMTNELVYSRNGLDYRRAAPRRPWIPLGPPGAFDSRMVIPQRLIEHDDEILVYYQGRNHDHGSDRGQNGKMTAAKTANGEPIQVGLGLARIKWGQFCGLHAKDQGIVETKWRSN